MQFETIMYIALALFVLSALMDFHKAQMRRVERNWQVNDNREIEAARRQESRDLEQPKVSNATKETVEPLEKEKGYESSSVASPLLGTEKGTLIKSKTFAQAGSGISGDTEKEAPAQNRKENMDRIVKKNVEMSINGTTLIAPKLERLLFGYTDPVNVDNCTKHTFYFYPRSTDQENLCKTVMAIADPHERVIYDIQFKNEPKYNGKYEWTRHGIPPEKYHEWGFTKVPDDTPLGLKQSGRGYSKQDWLDNAAEDRYLESREYWL